MQENVIYAKLVAIADVALLRLGVAPRTALQEYMGPVFVWFEQTVLLRLTLFFSYVTSQTAFLRHVHGFPALRLIRRLRPFVRRSSAVLIIPQDRGN